MVPKDLLLGELREFKRATIAKLDSIEQKVGSFERFQAKALGACTLAAFLATVLVEFLKR